MKKTFKLILVLYALGLGSGIFLYYTYKAKPKKSTKAVSSKTERFYLALDKFEDFKEIQGAPLSDKFNNVWSVKVVYDIDDNRLYYVRSDKFRYHFEFCRDVLNYTEPLEVFNLRNYGNTFGRRFYLANLNWYARSGIYALEFTSDERITPEQMVVLYQAVSKTSYIKDSLRLLVSSDYLAGLDQEQKLKLPRIYPADIYNNQQYQLLQPGKSYGILRHIPDMATKYTSIQAGDIVITKGTPVNVPLCAGIVTDIFQTPLSHINVLCHNREIPSAADRGIWADHRLDALEGKPVSFTVTEDSLRITAATAAELEAYRKARPAAPRTVLKGDVTTKVLLLAGNFGLRHKQIVGNKAAGLGELYKLATKYHNKFEVPEGAFAIPFYYYRQHVEQPEIKAAITRLLTDQRFRSDREALQWQLKLIRKKIKETPVDPALLQQVAAMIKVNNAGNSYRFRSSSNAEDREGFSGAGLYDSKTGVLGDTSKPIEKAIRAVWASAWNDVAYLEREAYNIDQTNVLMGVLVHRNFPDELCNGVAITKNIYRPDFPGMTVNVQVGEVEVVSPPDSVTCEQFVCVPVAVTRAFGDDMGVDYITYSNINKGKRVLNLKQVTQLYDALEQIKSHFYSKLNMDEKPEYDHFGLDIEFKFDRNNKLYIKQVRPYY